MPAPLSSDGRGPMKVMESRTTMHTKSSYEAGLLQRILPVIRRRALFSPGDSILVAVSGGPDSVALLSVLHELRPAWNLILSVIHINYGLRGRESTKMPYSCNVFAMNWRFRASRDGAIVSAKRRLAGAHCRSGLGKSSTASCVAWPVSRESSGWRWDIRLMIKLKQF